MINAAPPKLSSGGVDFVPARPVGWMDLPGFTNAVQYQQPGLPAQLLAQGDTITNLSATGALMTGYADEALLTGDHKIPMIRKPIDFRKMAAAFDA